MKALEPMKVIRMAGSRAKLARLLGIGRSAISQWRNAVPQQRVWQLQVKKREWFDDNGNLLSYSEVYQDAVQPSNPSGGELRRRVCDKGEPQ